jgi:hypothetical protein
MRVLPTALAALIAGTLGHSQAHGQIVEISVKSFSSALRDGVLGGTLGGATPDRTPTLPPPAPTEYSLACDLKDCPDPAKMLVQLLDAPSKSGLVLSDLSGAISWVRSASSEDIRKTAPSAHHALYSRGASACVRDAFDAARADTSLINQLFVSYYDPRHWWTDDSPHVTATIRFLDGYTIHLHSTAQQFYMIPWQIEKSGLKHETYEPEIGRALAALAPPHFVDTDRLAGTHSHQWLIDELFHRSFNTCFPPAK